jgi:hypothetical protein
LSIWPLNEPILCIGPTEGDAATIIKHAKAGKTLDYSDSKGIKIALESAIELWEQKEKSAMNADFIQSFSRRTVAGELAKIIMRLP